MPQFWVHYLVDTLSAFRRYIIIIEVKIMIKVYKDLFFDYVLAEERVLFHRC